MAMVKNGTLCFMMYQRIRADNTNRRHRALLSFVQMHSVVKWSKMKWSEVHRRQVGAQGRNPPALTHIETPRQVTATGQNITVYR